MQSKKARLPDQGVKWQYLHGVWVLFEGQLGAKNILHSDFSVFPRALESLLRHGHCRVVQWTQFRLNGPPQWTPWTSCSPPTEPSIRLSHPYNSRLTQSDLFLYLLEECFWMTNFSNMRSLTCRALSIAQSFFDFEGWIPRHGGSCRHGTLPCGHSRRTKPK